MTEKTLIKGNDVKELKHESTILKRYLDSFNEKNVSKIKEAKETADLHLDGKEMYRCIDPKGNPLLEVTHLEPHDPRLFLQSKEKLFWVIIIFVSIIFFLQLWYGGVLNV